MPPNCLLHSCWRPLAVGCSNAQPELLLSYRGHSFEEVVTHLGPPQTDRAFALTPTTRFYEYQSGLTQYREGSETLMVREASWVQPGNRRLVVWFGEDEGRWVGLEGLRWDTGRVSF